MKPKLRIWREECQKDSAEPRLPMEVQIILVSSEQVLKTPKTPGGSVKFAEYGTITARRGEAGVVDQRLHKKVANSPLSYPLQLLKTTYSSSNSKLH